MKKILKDIATGTWDAMMIMSLYILAGFSFKEAYSATGYNAVLWFLEGILVLGIALVAAWAVGYSDNETGRITIGKREAGDTDDDSGQLDD